MGDDGSPDENGPDDLVSPMAEWLSMDLPGTSIPVSEALMLGSGLFVVLGAGLFYILGSFAQAGYYWFLSVPQSAVQTQVHETLMVGAFLTIGLVGAVWALLWAWNSGAEKFRARLVGNAIPAVFLTALLMFTAGNLPNPPRDIQIGLLVILGGTVLLSILWASSFLHGLRGSDAGYRLFSATFLVGTILLAAGLCGALYGWDTVDTARDGRSPNALSVEFASENHPLANRPLVLLATGQSTFLFLDMSEEGEWRPTTYAVPVDSVTVVVVNA